MKTVSYAFIPHSEEGNLELRIGEDHRSLSDMKLSRPTSYRLRWRGNGTRGPRSAERVLVFWGLLSALIAAPSLFALIAWPLFKYPTEWRVHFLYVVSNVAPMIAMMPFVYPVAIRGSRNRGFPKPR